MDGADFLIWQQNYDPGVTGKRFTQGDATGNGQVTANDLIIYYNCFGQTGHVSFRADFNRDGCVDGSDILIWNGNQGLQSCATRFEGDANCDGRVDGDDLAILNAETATGIPYSGSTSCDCCCGDEENQGAASMAAGGDSGESGKNDSAVRTSDNDLLGNPRDLDDDGEFDRKDLEFWITYYTEQEGGLKEE